MELKEVLRQRFDAAFAAAGLEGPSVVQVANRPEFGDYQANGVMGAAKRAGRNPREVAGEVLEHLDLSGIAASVDIAGPGFINVTLSAEYLAQVEPGAITSPAATQTIVTDYSAPNLAKEMHVGHLRSTIIGDSVTRVLEAQGHTLIRQNHVGDWGTQFGMLLTYLRDTGENSDELSNLENFYRAAKQRFDEDPDFQDRSRAAVVGLQSGDPDALSHWQRFINISMSHCQEIYDRLGVTLQPESIMGESRYNDDLANVVTELTEKGLLVESDGAQCVFLDEFKTKKGDVVPIIVQKSDGGYLYATTDLAAVRHRTGTLNANRVIVFTDNRQALHFKQVFTLSEVAGFNYSEASLEHMPFGAMLGNDGKPFKTREGGVVKLADLLTEAESRARELLVRNNPDFAADELDRLAHAIGIGAIKYADLSKNRTSDYVFDWEQMITFEGNTAPYLQYAYARIQSIFRKGEINPEGLNTPLAAPTEPERKLLLSIAAFSDTVRQVGEEGFPHFLCAHLFELATRFTQFYDACPVLGAEGEIREQRLALCQATAVTLARGLDLLGIEAIERM